MDWAAWRKRMSRLAVQFCAGFQHRFGYPPDDHVVYGPTSPDDLQALVANGAVDVPDELIGFYRHIAAVSLPDLDNGYFIHSAAHVSQGLAGRVGSDVIQVAHESFHVPVVQIGSDGGGGLYVLERGSGGRVLYLPVGELRDGVYTGNRAPPPRMAASKLDDLLTGWEGRMREIVAEMAST
jgi:hypothetical protein